MLKYNKEPYCRLKSGKIEPLYYKKQVGNNEYEIDYSQPRTFYPDRYTWYLNYDKYGKGIIATMREEIVEFLTEEQVKNL